MAGGFDPKTFSKIPYQKRVEKPWGHEIIWTPDDAPATGKLLHILAGHRLSLQYHDAKRETLYLSSGQVMITLTDHADALVELPMEQGKGYHIMPGQVHRMTAVTDSDVFESSTPEIGNTFRLQDDAGRATETEEVRKMENRGWSNSSK